MPREDENNTRSIAAAKAPTDARASRRNAEFAEIDTFRKRTGKSDLTKSLGRSFGGNANSPHSRAIAEARASNSAHTAGTAAAAAEKSRLAGAANTIANKGAIRTVSRSGGARTNTTRAEDKKSTLRASTKRKAGASTGGSKVNIATTLGVN